MKTLVLASNNPGKLREFTQMLAPLGFAVKPQADFKVREVAEPHPTFVENALLKARHAAKYTGLPALADDSGLCVAALDGAPGVYSARYAGEPRDDQRNNHKLVNALADKRDASARYVCVLALVRHAADPQPLLAQGEWRGEIIRSPQGDNGFGYDPHFWLPQRQCTAAQLAPEVKNALSHRGQALLELVRQIRLAGNEYAWRA